MNVHAHRYIADTMPTCSVAPWSVNRAVNKLLQTANTKHTDHPRPYLGLLNAEPELLTPSVQYHRQSTAFGRLAIPCLLNRLRSTKNEEYLALDLKTLIEILHDPEKIEEALSLHVLNVLPKLISHKSAAVQSFAFALLIQISREPFGKVRIVSRPVILNGIEKAFESNEFLVRGTVYALVSSLASNWIAVERLVERGFIRLAMNALKELLIELDTHKSEIIYLLKSLVDMTDQEKGVWETIRFDAFYLKPLLLHQDSAVREVTADLFYNLLSSPLGQCLDISVSISKMIIRTLEVQDPPLETIPLLAITTINSEARSLVLNSEKVVKTCLDLYRNQKIPVSIRLGLHNILLNVAEMPLGRHVLLKRKHDIAFAKTFNLVPKEMMDTLIDTIHRNSVS